jgi:alpha-muurolene/germacrene-A/gamma-muurolene synthase
MSWTLPLFANSRIWLTTSCLSPTYVCSYTLYTLALTDLFQDIFSYDKEQARGDTHNMLVVVMNQRDLTINEAIDYVAELSEKLMNQFVETREKVPSWGEEIDKEMSIYLDGLQHWMIGILNWSFSTERYFGKAVADVKESRIVKLAPHKA